MGAGATPPGIEQPAPAAVVEADAPADEPHDPTAFTQVIEVDDHAGEGRQIADLIEQTPGVFVRRFGGPGEASEVSIRGSSGSQVVVLLDGVRLNSAQSGTVDLSTIPLDLIERIEVTRGGGSVQTGSDAIGGVVNLVTKRADARPRTRVSGAIGPFDTWSGAFTQTGRIGPLEAVAGYDHFETDGDWEFEPIHVSGSVDDNASVERINNRAERHGGLLKLGADVGDRARVELSDQIFHASEGVPGLDLPSGGAQRGQSQLGHRRRTRNVAQLRGLYATGRVETELRGFHRFERNRFRDVYGLETFDTDDRDTSLGGRADAAVTLGSGPVTLRPALGAELRRDALDAHAAPDRDRRVLGLFLQGELSLWDGRLAVVPALRFDETQGFGTEWLPRAGLLAAPLPWLELRANAERSYRVPNFDELYVSERTVRGNPALDPEEAWNYDAGLRLGVAPGGLLRSARLEAVYFQNDIDNTIVFQPRLDVVVATNVPDARVRGVELSARIELAHGVALGGSWTRLDSEVRRTGGPLPGRPEDELDLRAEIAPWDGFVSLVGELQHTGEIPANEGGTLRISERTTLDASIAVQLHRVLRLGERTGLSGLLLSVVGTNLTDRAVRDALFFPQPGRIVMLRLEAWR